MASYESRFAITHGVEDVIRNLNNSHCYVPQAKVDFWWARDLMLSAGYNYVDDLELERCVGYAVVCLTASDIDPRYHICRWTRHFPTIQTAGYDRNDYLLSRYASFWLARSLPVAMPYRKTVIDYMSDPLPDPDIHKFHSVDKRWQPITEVTYYCAQRDLAAYGQLCEEYQFRARLDFKTCRQCRELDGKLFRVVDAVPGINYPPLHSGCRSTTIAIMHRDWLCTVSRNALDPFTQEQVWLPPGSTYYTWFDLLVERYGIAAVREAREKVLAEPTLLPFAMAQ